MTLKRKITLVLFACCFLGPVSLVGGCKDATIAQWNSLGSKHKIYVYSGGQCVKTYESTGNISNEERSDGFYFEDAATHKLVEVAGTIVIEQE